MICKNDNQEMTKAGTGIRAGIGRCQKWQCSKCGYVFMENPGKPITPITGNELAPKKEVKLLTAEAVSEAMAGSDHAPEPTD